MSLTHLTVIGSGVLGAQIAYHSAFKGKMVVVHDVDPASLARCRAVHAQYDQVYRDALGATDVDIADTQRRLAYTSDLGAAVALADFVIEAVPEVPAIKSALYQQLAGLLPARTLVATNSSTFLPSDFAQATGRPDKFCALHFANMIWVMNFAELMAHAGTSRETLTAVAQFAVEIGMVPIPVHKPQNGYVANTWVVPLLNAAQTLVTNGIASPEDIDRTFMVLGARLGPMGMLDMVGMKTAVDVLSYWGAQSNDAQMSANAAYLKAHFLDQGKWGVQTGSGYYQYPDPAYARADFLAVPDLSAVPALVARIGAE